MQPQIPIPGEPASVLTSYVKTKYEVRSATDTSGAVALPSPENDRLTAEVAFRSKQQTRWINYGISVGILGVHESAPEFVVDYVENLATDLLEPDGERHDSFIQEFHRVTVRDGRVERDEYVGPDSPLFEELRTQSVITEIEIRPDPLRSDPSFENEDPDTSLDFSVDESDGIDVAVAALTRASSVAYAKRYCRNYNQAYPNYGADPRVQGGDCTNFASQSLEAGALPFVDDPRSAHRVDWATYWWSNRNNRSNHSLTWSLVASLYRHFVERFGSADRQVHWVWEDAHPGDVVFFDFERDGVWNHSCVVTTAERTCLLGICGSFKLRVSCHTNDVCDSDFYQMTRGRNWWIQIFHVRD